MQWNLRRIGESELSFGVFRKQIVDELFAGLRMRRAGDQHGGIGHDEAADLVSTLIGVDQINGLVLLHPIYDIIAIHEAEIKLAACDQIGAVTIAGGYLDSAVVQVLHESAPALVTPQRKERGNLVGRRTEQRICNHRPATPTRIRVRQH